ncbi:MAG TPA: DinB family protein [Acidobacteriaceae bacterium]|jgi:uncharacterized damage-inducible protein DinB
MPETLSAIGNAHLRYHRWALLEFFPVVEQLPEEKLLALRGTSFGSLYATLVHIYRADATWLARLRGDADARLAQFNSPEAFGELKSEWIKLLDQWTAWGTGLTEDDWASLIDVVNSKGVASSVPVWQVVFQVVNHGTGHLGQANGILRQIGIAPPNTDLIRFYRLEAS